MNLTELNKKIDGLKKDLAEAVREEINEDRIKTATNERKEARAELNDGFTVLERVDLSPENAQHIGRLIAAIEWLRSANDSHIEANVPPTPGEIEKIAEARKIPTRDAETLLYAVRGSEMLKRIEGMKPQVLAAIMEGTS
jgi:hypothetical protein